MSDPARPRLKTDYVATSMTGAIGRTLAAYGPTRTRVQNAAGVEVAACMR